MVAAATVTTLSWEDKMIINEHFPKPADGIHGSDVAQIQAALNSGAITGYGSQEFAISNWQHDEGSQTISGRFHVGTMKHDVNLKGVLVSADRTRCIGWLDVWPGGRRSAYKGQWLVCTLEPVK